MRTCLYLVALLAAALAAPAPAPQPGPQPGPQPAALNDQTPEIIEIIAPAASAQVRPASISTSLVTCEGPSVNNNNEPYNNVPPCNATSRLSLAVK